MAWSIGPIKDALGDRKREDRESIVPFPAIALPLPCFASSRSHVRVFQIPEYLDRERLIFGSLHIEESTW